MRASSVFCLALGIVIAGCGGNVVVDGTPQSQGAGGAGGSAVVSSSSGSGGGVSCANQGCGSGSDGSCQCEGMCSDGHSRSVTCTPIPPEASCACAQDQVLVGTCTTPPDAPISCDLLGGCCDAFFFGAPDGG